MKKKTPGYPLYPPGEDIYSKGKEEKDINPEDPSELKGSVEDENTVISENGTFNEISPGGDLDVPGSELDDTQEMIGSEDEENNYYSLGGDDHDNLEEDT